MNIFGFRERGPVAEISFKIHARPVLAYRTLTHWQAGDPVRSCQVDVFLDKALAQWSQGPALLNWGETRQCHTPPEQ